MNRNTFKNRLQFYVVFAVMMMIICCYFILTTFHHQITFKFVQLRKKGITKVKMCPIPKVEIESFNQPRVLRISKQKNSISENKTILLWTNYFDNAFSKDFYFFHEKYNIFDRYQCPFRQCLITNDRTHIKQADAILFHLVDIQDLPKFKYRNQKWILYNLEALSHKSYWYQKRNLFNLIMSYRDDSDIKTKYGVVCELPEEERDLALERKDYYKNKSKEIVWFVSNCNTSNNRIKYARKLSKYIHIDIYGNCGRKRCGPTQSKQCYDDILKEYKFYLSFENSICEDYVTEKFFNILNYDIVPIVMGGADYEAISPPNSFIDTRDFPNPKDLAKYLRNISGNKDLYNSFFEWKGKYKSYLHPWMCEMCQKLHESEDESTKQSSNHDTWWNSYMKCIKWKNNAFVKA